MKKIILLFVIVLTFTTLFAQGPKGKDFGFGLSIGDPTGIAAKYWLNRENALAFSLGSSYFGALRVGGDYLWHFDVFNSNVVKMYAGPGAIIGFGDGNNWRGRDDDDYYVWDDDDDFGLGARAVVGLNFIPRRTPIEIFAEVGVLVGLIPAFGTSVDGAIGIRFYP